MMIFFNKKKVQSPGRIVIDKALLSNADLKIGDEVMVFLDANTKNIVITKPKDEKSLQKFLNHSGFQEE